MKVYKTQSEVEKDIKNSLLLIKGDVRFDCSISIEASIKVVAGNINAWNINARNINAWNINARNINAEYILARNINAWNINAGNIEAWNIEAWDIEALDIKYYAFCNVYNSIKCTSIEATREPHSKPICLSGAVEIRPATNPKEITIEGARYRLVENE